VQELLKLLPDILKALPTHPVALIALVVLVVGFISYLVIDKKDRPGLRYAALFATVASLLLLVWWVVKIGKDIQEEKASNEIQSCTGRILAVLDDHLGSRGTYELAVSVEGNEAYHGSLAGVLPHGAPWGGAYTNWTDLPFSVNLTRRLAKRPSLDVQFQLGGSPNANDFLGVSEIRLTCPDGNFFRLVNDMFKYGPDGRPTGILYIGGSKMWAVQRDKDS